MNIINPFKSEPLEIVMLGHSGVGKSSVLSAMWHDLDNLPLNPQKISLAPAKGDDTYRKMNDRWGDILKKASSPTTFGSPLNQDIDMSGTIGLQEYRFDFTAGNSKEKVVFVDSQGVYTKELNPELIKRANNALGLFYVIDAAVLMECGPSINHEQNNPTTLKQIIREITEDDDKKQPAFLVFILTKCEKYMKESGGKGRLYKGFDDLYGTTVQFIKSKGIKTYYIPIQTIGCVEFSRLSDEEPHYPLFKSTLGEVCPVDTTYPLTIAFNHLLDKMSEGFLTRLKTWLRLQKDVRLYKEMLTDFAIAHPPQDYREF